MFLPAAPQSELPPLTTFSIGDVLPTLGVSPGPWEFFYSRYLSQLLIQHEDDFHPAIPSRTLTDQQFVQLMCLAARLGAVAGIAAIDALRPPEPPF